MHAQRGMKRTLLMAKGGVQVSAEELPAVIARLLDDPRERERLGDAGREAVRRNQGSAERCAEVIASLIC